MASQIIRDKELRNSIAKFAGFSFSKESPLPTSEQTTIFVNVMKFVKSPECRAYWKMRLKHEPKNP